MAIPIKAVPILSGDVADDFVNRADVNERLPRHSLTLEQERAISEALRRSRDFIPSWQKK